MKHNILLLVFIATLISCNQTKNNIETENQKVIDSLSMQIDFLSAQIDSIKSTTVLLFDSALYYEQNNSEKAKEIYQTIIKNSEKSFWTVQAEEKLKLMANKKTVMPFTGMLWGSDTLELTQKGDECGEWGGNVVTIKIFKEGYNKLMAYCVIEKYTCEELEQLYPNPEPAIKSEIKELNLASTKIAENCIIDLLKQELKSQEWLCHSGIHNTVELKRGNSRGLYIDDYPSFSWEKFHLLKTEILK
ncbi:MAG: hypothetical protein LBN27_03775 [Prevotellaceae bacterium]|jgi:hypothetical protein|nr:hypothetical protein [Prevotellaceae bacterium]